MKDRFGWFSVIVLLVFLSSSSTSSCAVSNRYGTMSPSDEPQWLKCQTQKTMGEKCQRYPYWKKLSRSRLA